MDRNAPDYRGQIDDQVDFKDLADAIATLTVDGTSQQFPLHSQFLAKLSNHVSVYVHTKKGDTPNTSVISQLDLTELFKNEDANSVLWFFYLAYCQDYQSSLKEAVRDALQCLDIEIVGLLKGLYPNLERLNKHSIRDPFNALVTFLQFCDKFEAPVGLWQCVEAAVAQHIVELSRKFEVSFPLATEPIKKVCRGVCFTFGHALIIEWTVLARHMEHRMPGLMDHIHDNSLFFKPRGGNMGVYRKDPTAPMSSSDDDDDPLWQQAAQDWEEEFDQYE